MKNILFSVALMATQFSQAEPVKAKFENYLNKIQTEVLSYTSDKVDIKQLSQGSLRQTLFTIQTMANLYSSKYATLENVRIESKRLEDSIGNYRKTIEQYEYAEQHEASKEKLQELQRHVDAGAAHLQDLMKSKNWIKIPGGKIEELSNIIEAIVWDSEIKEKNDSYLMMANQLTRVDQTDWNMTVLEGQGIHDLRKEMRWYKLQFSALSDIMAPQNQTCGGKIQKPSQTGGTCLISACYHDQMSQIYDIFGSIKDEGEGQDGLGHEIDQELLRPAQELYKQIKKERLFENLSHEFQACVEMERL